MKNDLVILLDNGHGVETAGKRSLDGTFREYRWTRDFAKLVFNKLKAADFMAFLVTPEEQDISISKRVRRVNQLCIGDIKTDYLLISIHNDAAQVGYGNWASARGFSSLVSLNSSAQSRYFAKLIQSKMYNSGYRGNRALPPYGFRAQKLALLSETSCPAVLLEYLFMTNDDDLLILKDARQCEKMADLLVDTIKMYQTTRTNPTV